MEIIKQREIKGIYKLHDEQKFKGAHYTPNNLAQFVASRILEQHDGKLNEECSIFDPAVGDGELLYALTALLIENGVKKILISGFDIDPNAVRDAHEKLKFFGDKVAIEIMKSDFTEQVSEPNLLSQSKLDRQFDFIIANPPYVRTQSLGSKETSRLSDEFLLDGRIDLYYVFLLGISKFMHDQTIAGFIVSNRFMTTKSGATVRKGLVETYSINEIWDLGDTKLFDAAVLPAVLVFSKKQPKGIEPKFSSIYSTKNNQNIKKVDSVFKALLSNDGNFSVGLSNNFEVKSGKLRLDVGHSEVWRVSNSETDGWLQQVEDHTEKVFKDIGKVRVGVKTTADKVFIKKDWETLPESCIPEKAVLKPLITHHFASRFKQIDGNNRRILYPHISVNGKKRNIALDQYPNARRYLETHKAQLESREYLIEAGREWFEIWVPHEPDMWKRPKIVFRDICDRPTFWMDTSGAIVNGDCYWITNFDSIDSEYLWIALAVANSTFIEAFYDHKFNNKLYAGRRRYMTQYVEQFPIPIMSHEIKDNVVSLTKEIVTTLPKPCEEKEAVLDKLIWTAFGFT